MGLFHMKRNVPTNSKGASGGAAPFSKGFTSGPSKFEREHRVEAVEHPIRPTMKLLPNELR